MTALAILFGHALAALLFVTLALWQTRRPASLSRDALTLAAAGMAGWATTVALAGPESTQALVSESLRNICWLAFMFTLLGRGEAKGPHRAIVALYAVLGMLAVAQIGIDLMPDQFDGSPRILAAIFGVLLVLRLIFSVGALLLVHNLYVAAAPQARSGIRLPMMALAGLWTFDLNLYTVAYLAGAWPRELFALRGVFAALLVLPLALASRRNPQWRMRLSRAATFQTLSLIAIGSYLMAMVIVARALKLAGFEHLHLAEITLVGALAAAALLLLPSARLRAWLRVKIVKHFFQHRYDYRAEWMRFTATLGRPGDGGGPVDERVVKAMADITESPGGLLLLPDEAGGLTPGAHWCWPTIEAPRHAASHELARHLETTGWIIELDAIRQGKASPPLEPPAWMIEQNGAWAVAPLVHFDRLVGAVLLARPVLDRTLDWEDFDLLRAAGRQAASYLAEARGQEALSDAKRFDEFNRRFAFVVHDIKNLVSQLSLVARNAERHADNPDFRADMVATLQSSVGKMNDLLARLSQHNKARAEEPRPVALRALADAIAGARRAAHPVRVKGRSDVMALADPPRLEQAIVHLVQNAIDASPAREPVWLTIERRGIEATVEILDRGAGMSPEFLRTRLFKPFASTKEGGFGIGAFEARSIVAGMGGRLEVESREGEGSRFTITLPLARGEKSKELAA